MIPVRLNVTATRSEWWDPASDFATPPGRRFNIKGRVLYLDPAATSPNVTVAIRLDGSSPFHLRPGESLVLPHVPEAIWIGNPLIGMLDSSGAATGVFGVVTLLVGGMDSLAGWKARANRTRPMPHASLIAIQKLVLGSLKIPTAGLEKLRVLCVPLDAADVPLAPPAALAGTIGFDTQLRIGVDAAGAFSYPVVESQDQDTGLFAVSGAGQGFYCYDAASSFAISQTQTIMDFEVGAGLVGVLTISGLAGAGVAEILAYVYGS